MNWISFRSSSSSWILSLLRVTRFWGSRKVIFPLADCPWKMPLVSRLNSANTPITRRPLMKLSSISASCPALRKRCTWIRNKRSLCFRFSSWLRRIRLRLSDASSRTNPSGVIIASRASVTTVSFSMPCNNLMSAGNSISFSWKKIASSLLICHNNRNRNTWCNCNPAFSIAKRRSSCRTSENSRRGMVYRPLKLLRYSWTSCSIGSNTSTSWMGFSCANCSRVCGCRAYCCNASTRRGKSSNCVKLSGYMVTKQRCYFFSTSAFRLSDSL